MDRVSQMLETLSESSVRFLEFTRIFSQKPDVLICFFEGEDVKYYGIRIQNFSNNHEWLPIECKGKKDVLNLYDSIFHHADYKNANVLFFIDKDFDNPIETKNSAIYETPCYSVENFYVTKTCFERIIQAEFKLTEFCESSDCYFNCIDMFLSLQEQFHESLKYLNSWIKAHRLKEQRQLETEKLNLNNVKLNRMISISLEGISKIYRDEELASLYNCSEEIEHDLINSAMHSFKDHLQFSWSKEREKQPDINRMDIR